MNMEKQTLMKVLQIGGIVVLILGIVWVGRGLLFPRQTVSYAAPGAASVAVIKGDFQEVAIDLQSGAYAPIIVQKGIPVRFTIRAEDKNINSCNGSVVINEYNVQKTLKPGDNILEFTPSETGTFAYSCWMGMVTSSIQVVDDLDQADPSAVPIQANGGLRMPCCQPQ